ncbi:MAG: methyltransferase [Lysobacter sp.]|nr:methyltransferase [Lysobacter sp.]
MIPMLRIATLATALVLASACTPTPVRTDATPAASASASLDAAITGNWRDSRNSSRDRYRHPRETLLFFGVKPDQTIIEITPGSGWYSEILAPYLRDRGHYIAAVVDPAAAAAGRSRDYQQKTKTDLETKYRSGPAQYDRVQVVAYDPKAPHFGAANSADVVLTFRNVHNWRMAGQAEGMFKAFYDVLKPGGTLGVVEHRAKADVPADDATGYVGQAQVIAMAQAAGFTLADSAEINANPRDTKDYADGVWTLPPVLRLKDKDREKYLAIGESDRMTLRFVKPAK